MSRNGRPSARKLRQLDSLRQVIRHSEIGAIVCIKFMIRQKVVFTPAYVFVALWNAP